MIVWEITDVYLCDPIGLLTIHGKLIGYRNHGKLGGMGWHFREWMPD